LAALVLAAGWQLGSGSSVLLHILGIAVHLLTSVLVYLLARRLLLRKTSEVVAMSAGLLFALHPAVTQSVYYVSHIGSSLATLLTLASILLYLRFGVGIVAHGLCVGLGFRLGCLDIARVACCR
jgi:hypothetical protein